MPGNFEISFKRYTSPVALIFETPIGACGDAANLEGIFLAMERQHTPIALPPRMKANCVSSIGRSRTVFGIAASASPLPSAAWRLNRSSCAYSSSSLLLTVNVGPEFESPGKIIRPRCMRMQVKLQRHVDLETNVSVSADVMPKSVPYGSKAKIRFQSFFMLMTTQPTASLRS